MGDETNIVRRRGRWPIGQIHKKKIGSSFSKIPGIHQSGQPYIYIFFGGGGGGGGGSGRSLRHDVAIGPVSFLSRGLDASLSLSLCDQWARGGRRAASSTPSSETRRAPPVNDAHHSYLRASRYACLLRRTPLSGRALLFSHPPVFYFFHIPLVIVVLAHSFLSPPVLLDTPLHLLRLLPHILGPGDA